MTAKKKHLFSKFQKKKNSLWLVLMNSMMKSSIDLVSKVFHNLIIFLKRNQVPYVVLVLKKMMIRLFNF